MTSLKIDLHFLEPFRLIEHRRDSSRQRQLRGSNFARWHKSKTKKGKAAGGRPFITGTLLRSAVIRAVEEELVRSDNSWNCCPGKFFTDGKDKKTDEQKSQNLRHRATLKWPQASGESEKYEVCQDYDSACPLCLILGLHFEEQTDKQTQTKAPKKIYPVGFGNLSLPDNSLYFPKPDAVGTKRKINRVDNHTGKAHDYLTIWEIDGVTDFTGVIKLADNLDDNRKQTLKQLLERVLPFIDQLCGALCTIKITDNSKSVAREFNDSASSENGVVSLAKNSTPAAENNKPSPDDLCGRLLKTPQLKSYLRPLADALRSLRSQNPQFFSLPKGHLDQNNRHTDHYLWDKVLFSNSGTNDSGQTLREYLKNVAEEFKSSPDQWRRFCEECGQKLYDGSKGKDLSNPVKPDTGADRDTDTLQVSTSPTSYGANSRINSVFSYEWIITGTLVAQTPFFVGSDLIDNDHTSFRVLLDRENRFRLPRSVLRGALRRDLNLVSGKGCLSLLGSERPCVCPTCQILRSLTLRDSVSAYQAPPEIRHRIKRLAVTGTVLDGALFDAENGPQAARFPFSLRYRAKENEEKPKLNDALPPELDNALAWWKNGKLFLGGHNGVGKGRFQLTEIGVYRWSLADETGCKSYAEHFGLRDNEKELAALSVTVSSDKSGSEPSVISEEEVTTKLPSSKTISSLELRWPPEDTSSENNMFLENVSSPWKKRAWEFTFTGPVLSNDPIAALTSTDSDSVNAVFCSKSVLDETGQNSKRIQILRGESLRGLLRTAMGRNLEDQDALVKDHTDCLCELCQVFGNEHRAGHIRIEDMEPVNPENSDTPQVTAKIFHHNSSDRFDASVVEKFSDKPLIGSPDKPLVFSGIFWSHSDLESNSKTKSALEKTFRDIDKGLYPVGGNCGVGYGLFKLTGAKPFGNNSAQDNQTVIREDQVKSADLATIVYTTHPTLPTLGNNNGAIYNPYYYIPLPEKEPQRINHPVSHQKFHSNKLTGKITCTLTTITPLLLPDSTTEIKDDNGHCSYDTMKLNDTVIIPGVALRAAISRVYETLSNSCFRVMKQKRRLSWRMEAGDFAGDKSCEYENRFRPGKVMIETVKDGSKKITIKEMESARLPLYDNEKVTMSIDESDTKVHNNNLELAECAEQNRKSLSRYINDQDINPENIGHILVKFNKPKELGRDADGEGGNPYDRYVKLCENDTADSMYGYLLLSGPNNATIKNVSGGTDNNYSDDFEDPLKFSLNGEKEHRKSNIIRYYRPGFSCIKDGKQYTFSKRCERVFYDKENSNSENEFTVPSGIARRYADLLAESRRNTRDTVAQPFRTRLRGKLASDDDNLSLQDGDLVYFRKDLKFTEKNVVDAIIPVAIFREADDRLLGSRLPEAWRSCAHVCLEDCDKCVAQECPLPLYREGYPGNGLCPACHLFGTQMYKGRLRFSFARPVEGGNESESVIIDEPITLPLQERPRPTWVLPKEVRGDDKKEIPGRKFYLRHNGWKKIVKGKDPGTDIKISEDPNNITCKEPVAKDNEFAFDIYFENLDPEELGWLLYSLELEENMVHALGRGKAFGFGSAKIKVEKISQRLDAETWADWRKCDNVLDRKIVADALEKLSSAARNESNTKTEWYNLEHIAALRFMLTQHSELKAYYPELTNDNTDDNTDDPPGYIQLKKSNRYNPVEDLVCDPAGNANPIKPWYVW